jgi:hypothetical protein
MLKQRMNFANELCGVLSDPDTVSAAIGAGRAPDQRVAAQRRDRGSTGGGGWRTNLKSNRLSAAVRAGQVVAEDEAVLRVALHG